MFHGKVDGKGNAQVSIEMDSVSGGIPLRDERMRNELFRSPSFRGPCADEDRPAPHQRPGQWRQVELRLPVTVTLHGQSHRYDTLLLATRLDERRFRW